MKNEFKEMFAETAAEESGGFALIETGTYEAELTDCKLDLTKDPARMTFVYELTDEPNVGKKMFSNYQLEGRGIGFLKKDLTTLGLDFENVGSPEDIATLVWDAMPLPVVVFVNQKEWQGKMYNNTYLNALNDKPAVHSAPKAATNPKEEARQQAKGMTKTASGRTTQPPAHQRKAAGRAQQAASNRKSAPKTDDGFGDEPNFDDSDSIPF